MNTNFKGCISISLYGDRAKYVYGAYENVKLASKIYPDWDVIIHIEEDHYAIDKLTSLGAKVRQHKKKPGSRGMFWRFEPADDCTYTHVVIRDADSRLNVRGAAATQEWVESGKSLHVMRDNKHHFKKSIMGGAWGIKTGTGLPMKKLIDEWAHNNKYGDDEKFLGEKVWQHFYGKNDFLRHCFKPGSDDDTPFPDHAPYDGFVCEPIVPKFDLDMKVVLLSPERYASRRERFNRYAEKADWLPSVDWYVAKTQEDRVIPQWWFEKHSGIHKKHPHYYLATQDHIDIIQQAILDDVEYLCVLEDDCIFNGDAEEYLLRAIVAMPDNWWALMIGGQPHSAHNRKHTDEVGLSRMPEALAYCDGVLGMHAIIWNREGLRRAYNHFTYWNFKTIDQAFVHFQRQHKRVYAPAKWLVGIDKLSTQWGKDS